MGPRGLALPLYRTEDGCYVVCPFCRLPLPEEIEEARLASWAALDAGRPMEPAVLPCPRCGRQLAGEVTDEEQPDAHHVSVPCSECGQLIDGRASYCHYCRREVPVARYPSGA